MTGTSHGNVCGQPDSADSPTETTVSKKKVSRRQFVNDAAKASAAIAIAKLPGFPTIVSLWWGMQGRTGR